MSEAAFISLVFKFPHHGRVCDSCSLLGRVEIHIKPGPELFGVVFFFSVLRAHYCSTFCLVAMINHIFVFCSESVVFRFLIWTMISRLFSKCHFLL